MSEKYIHYFRQILGAFTLVVLVGGAYYSYKVFAYIVNWEPGSRQIYETYMSILVYMLFTLVFLFVIYDTLRRRGTRGQ